MINKTLKRGGTVFVLELGEKSEEKFMPFTIPQPLVIFQADQLKYITSCRKPTELVLSPLCTCNANCLLVAPTELQAQGLK